MQIAFATYAGLDGLTPSDALAAVELERRGSAVVPVPWSSAADWRQFDAVVIRATWDYHRRADEFLAWLSQLEEQRVPLWNPTPLARWNLHKGYLRDLEQAGVAVVPTAWISRSAQPESLEQLVRSRGWSDVVVKPAVSATAYNTWRVREVGDRDERQFQSLMSAGDLMVQPFIPSLVEEGEWSFVFLGGEFSHAVLKRAAPGDFRVQSNFGGTVARRTPPDEWVLQASAVLDPVQGPWLYARVDGCIVEGRFILVELEMLEPDLFLNHEPEAPARFADALLRLLA